MSAAIVVGAVGVAASLYSGISASNSAKKAREQAKQEWQANQDTAHQEQVREAPFQKVVQDQTSALQGPGLTPEGQQAEDRFKADTGATERQIASQAALAGSGVTGGRQLTAQFGQAQGIAGIGLQDAVNKRAALGGWVDKGLAVPGGTKLATGANADAAGFSEREAGQDRTGATSAYGEAAVGLGNLAKLYQKPAPETASTSNDGTNGTSEAGVWRNPRLMDVTQANVAGVSGE